MSPWQTPTWSCAEQKCPRASGPPGSDQQQVRRQWASQGVLHAACSLELDPQGEGWGAASAGAPRGSGAGGRAAAGPGRARGGLRAGLTPCWPRCARARTPACGERAQGRRVARLPRPAPTSPAVALRGARSGAAGRAHCGGPAGAGAGPGAASCEPGWISRFHPDSPSALPADSVLLGDHVTRAAFDPGLGAGRGRGPGPEGCQTRDPRGRCSPASVPEAMTPSKQSPGETNKLFGVREGLALGVGEAAEGRRGAQRHVLAATYRPGIAGWAPGLRVACDNPLGFLRQQVPVNVTPPGQDFPPTPTPTLPVLCS